MDGGCENTNDCIDQHQTVSYTVLHPPPNPPTEAAMRLPHLAQSPQHVGPVPVQRVYPVQTHYDLYGNPILDEDQPSQEHAVYPMLSGLPFLPAQNDQSTQPHPDDQSTQPDDQNNQAGDQSDNPEEMEQPVDDSAEEMEQDEEQEEGGNMKLFMLKQKLRVKRTARNLGSQRKATIEAWRDMVNIKEEYFPSDSELSDELNGYQEYRSAVMQRAVNRRIRKDRKKQLRREVLKIARAAQGHHPLNIAGRTCKGPPINEETGNGNPCSTSGGNDKDLDPCGYMKHVKLLTDKKLMAHMDKVLLVMKCWRCKAEMPTKFDCPVVKYLKANMSVKMAKHYSMVKLGVTKCKSCWENGPYYELPPDEFIPREFSCSCRECPHSERTIIVD